MIKTYYRPSAKGLKNGLQHDDRIVFMNEHYIWFKAEPNFFFEPTGDITEWKPRKKKPDSMWTADGTVDITTIDGYNTSRLKDAVV